MARLKKEEEKKRQQRSSSLKISKSFLQQNSEETLKSIRKKHGLNSNEEKKFINTMSTFNIKLN